MDFCDFSNLIFPHRAIPYNALNHIPRNTLSLLCNALSDSRQKTHSVGLKRIQLLTMVFCCSLAFYIYKKINKNSSIRQISALSPLIQEIDALKRQNTKKKEALKKIIEFIQSQKKLADLFVFEYSKNKEFIAELNLEPIEGHPEDLLYQKRLSERELLLTIHKLNDFFYFLRILPDLKTSFFNHLQEQDIHFQSEIRNILPEDLRKIE